jgi:hypothetical protein
MYIPYSQLFFPSPLITRLPLFPVKKAEKGEKDEGVNKKRGGGDIATIAAILPATILFCHHRLLTSYIAFYAVTLHTTIVSMYVINKEATTIPTSFSSHYWFLYCRRYWFTNTPFTTPPCIYRHHVNQDSNFGYYYGMLSHQQNMM